MLTLAAKDVAKSDEQLIITTQINHQNSRTNLTLNGGHRGFTSFPDLLFPFPTEKNRKIQRYWKPSEILSLTSTYQTVTMNVQHLS